MQKYQKWKKNILLLLVKISFMSNTLHAKITHKNVS